MLTFRVNNMHIEAQGLLLLLRYRIFLWNSAYKLKSCEISFAHNIFLRFPKVLKFCTEHGSWHCHALNNNFKTIEMDASTNEISWEFRMSSRGISYIKTAPAEVTFISIKFVVSTLAANGLAPSGVRTCTGRARTKFWTHINRQVCNIRCTLVDN